MLEKSNRTSRRRRELDRNQSNQSKKLLLKLRRQLFLKKYDAINRLNHKKKERENE